MSGSSASFTRPGLKCVKCDLPFALSLMAAEIRVEKLPDPFEAKCPMCQHAATYPKSAIQILVGVGHQ